MMPLLLMLSPVGAPVMANVHGVFGQVEGSGQADGCAERRGLVRRRTVGLALTVQVNAAEVTLTLAASVMVTATLCRSAASRRPCR